MDKFKKPLKFLYYFVVTCLFLIALLLIVSVFPITGNLKFLIVESGSMEPTIQTGAIVMVKPASDYEIGDVVTFKKGEETVTHRLHDMEVVEGQTYFVTKGDANNAPDSEGIHPQAVIGKVLLDIPYLGYVVDFAKKPVGCLAVLVLPALVIIGDEIRKIWREVKRIKKNKNKDKQQDEKIEHLEEELEELRSKDHKK